VSNPGEGREKGYVLLDRDDFERCHFPDDWDRVIDCNGDGVNIHFKLDHF